MSTPKLTALEEKFCLVYTCGPSPYNGNAKMTYNLVFNNKSGKLFNPDTIEKDTQREVECSLAARQLMQRDEIKDRIDQLQSETLVNAASLRPRLTETLLRIADECSTMVCEDRFGNPVSPAALRSVAVNAISKLTDMYGIKEDIAHKVLLENSGGDGITFNLIMPEKQENTELNNLLQN